MKHVMVSKTRALIIVSIFLLLIEGVFILINYLSSWEAFEKDLATAKTHLESTFFVSLFTVEDNMQQIATYIANVPEIQDLFLKGKKAVEKEGGGQGGPLAAEIRSQLYDRVKAGWEKMIENYDVRQLHFHLGPGSLSYLRVHKRKKFGDRMDHVRHTIVDVNTYLQPVKGFETGRVYSGIRGAVPVFAKDPESGRTVHVGALEAGTSMETVLKNLRYATRFEVAAILRKDHLQKYVWPEFLQQRLRQDRFGEQMVLEDASCVDLSILRDKRVQDAVLSGESIVVTDRAVPVAVMSVPFHDYRQSRNPGGRPVGYIVGWLDVDERLQSIRDKLRTNILFGIAGFLFLELIFILAWRVGTENLKEAIRRKTADLKASNEQLVKEIEEREQAEERYHDIFQNAPVGIYRRSVDYEFFTVNMMFARILGYTSSDELIHALDKDIRKIFFNEKDYDAIHDLLDKDQMAEGFECQVKRQDGTVIWTSWSVRVHLEGTGEQKTWIDSFVTDITERKKLEALKEDVERIMRHDLKGPLAGIINLPELIRMRGPLNESQEKHLENIEQASYRMSQMINMSLNLYKIETNTYQISPVDLKVVPLLERVLDELRGFTDNCGVDVHFAGPKDDDSVAANLRFPGEELLCFTMFQNLIKNAVEASSRGDAVTISITPAADSYITVQIHNAGKIPSNILPVFFEKYATSGKRQGSGLGTYSAKLIAQLHGGDIIIAESSEEGGTVIAVQLPREL